jgi:hypothetical protein
VRCARYPRRAIATIFSTIFLFVFPAKAGTQGNEPGVAARANADEP